MVRPMDHADGHAFRPHALTLAHEFRWRDYNRTHGLEAEGSQPNISLLATEKNRGRGREKDDSIRTLRTPCNVSRFNALTFLTLISALPRSLDKSRFRAIDLSAVNAA